MNYTATVQWARQPGEPFTDNHYSRGHRWSFGGGVSFRASSAPNVVPHCSDPAGVEPEEARIAAISSCHMLTFLYLAAKAGRVIDSYDDTAEGKMAQTDGRVSCVEGRLAPVDPLGWRGPRQGRARRAAPRRG